MSNVYERLQKARIELQNTELKKSGHNKFAGYNYFELADFLPTVQDIFSRHGLFGHVSFNADLAVLNIRAIDKPEETIQFLSPMADASLKGCHPIQNLGAVQTYLRRYLWVNALEIVEHDALDATTGQEAPVKKSEERKPLAFTPEELKEEKQLANIEGKRGEFQMVIDPPPEGDKKEWLALVKEGAHTLLEFCSSDADVMTIFKKNKVLFDTVKQIDPVFFKDMMVKFTETKTKFTKE